MISLGKIWDAQTADQARAQLEEAGITALLKRDDAGGLLPHLTAIHGVEILVHEADLKTAQEILLPYFTSSN